MLTPSLLDITLLVAFACLYGYALCLTLGRLRAIDRATAEYRIALDFIAEERCELPHEFAACFMAGNRIAIEHTFPDFAAYRTTWLLERQSLEVAE